MTTEAIDVMRVLEAVRDRNPVAKALGITIESGSLGRARAVMPVREDMVNSKGTLHGGYSALLADQAAGWACMTHNEQAVTQSALITYVSAGELGEELVADGEELVKTKRGGTYDVRITTRDGRVVVLARCQYVVLQGNHIIEPGS